MNRARTVRVLFWLACIGLLLFGCMNPFSGRLPDSRPAGRAGPLSSSGGSFMLASGAAASLPAGTQVMHFEQNLDSNLGPDQFVPYVYQGTTYAYYTAAIKKYGDYSLTGVDAAGNFSLLQRMYNLPAVQSQGFVAMPQKDFHGAFWLFVPATGVVQNLVLHTFTKNISWPVYYAVSLNIYTTSVSGELRADLVVQKREDYGATQTAAAYATGAAPAADQSWHLVEYWFDKNQSASGRAHLFVDGTEIGAGDASGSSPYDPSDIYDGDGGENSQECELRVMNGACVDDLIWNPLLNRSTADHDALHAAIEAYRTSGLPWGSGLPLNLVQLYPSAADVPGGATLLSSYFGLFPRITADPDLLGTTGGSESHDGALHGASPAFSTNPAYATTRSAVWTILFPNAYVLSWGSTFHLHTVPSHVHAASANHLPLCFDLVPASHSQAGSTALFLFQGGSIPPGWIQYAQYDDRYLRFNSDGGTAGNASHEHMLEMFTSAVTFSTTRRSWNYLTWSPTHTHPYNHGHAMSNEPKYRTVRLIARGDGQPVLDLNELPSGTIALFGSADVPLGWTLLGGPVEEGSLLRHDLETSGAAGGSVTHSHSGIVHAGDMIHTGSRQGDSRGTYGSIIRGGNHTHQVPYAHHHSGAVDWMPPFVYLFAALKN